MAKRRLISLLPTYNQTSDLQAFFGSTVDQVFQPGTSEPISGYIGRHAATDNAQDFFVGEPTPSRAAYQLETGMISQDTNGNLQDVLSYPDFIGYLQTTGANVSDQQRLNETEFYTYSPPINIDMLVNYHNYYWFGDRLGAADLPYLTLSIPITYYYGTSYQGQNRGQQNPSSDKNTIEGYGTGEYSAGAYGRNAITGVNGTGLAGAPETDNWGPTIYLLPPSIISVPIEAETPAVYVNNLLLDPSQYSIITGIVVGGVSGVGCAGALFNGTVMAPVDAASGEPVRQDAVIFVTPPPIPDPLAWGNRPNIMITRVPDYASVIAGQTSVDVSDLNSNGVTTLSSGMRIKIIDARYIIGTWDAQPWDDGVVIGGATGVGIAGALFDGAASAPSVVAAGQPVNRDCGWDFGGDGIYIVDGIGSAAFPNGLRLTADDTIIRNLAAQYVTIDRSSRDQNLWSLHNSWVHRDTLAWATEATFTIALANRQAMRPIIEFIRDLELWHVDAQLTTTSYGAGDMLSLTQTLPDVTGRAVRGTHIAEGCTVQSISGTTIIISEPLLGDIAVGTTITLQQVWSESSDPLFMLYDLNEVALNDFVTYPGSDFVGSSVFSYAIGSTPLDPFILQTLSFDQNGYYNFVNKPVTERYTYANGAITGLYAYGINAGSSIQSLWHLAPTTTAQSVSNGFYNVPLNLQANPVSDDVATISRSTWTTHFTSIIANQPGLIGQPGGANNYRDTMRDLTLGTAILQHRAPLLKAMLLAANTSFNLPQAIRYADQEYNRFRNKFARRLVEFYNNGVLLDPQSPGGDAVGTWVNTTLRDLKRDKTSQAPFALNTIAGDHYFIPPTPTCLGILPAAVPAMVTDTTTYPTPVSMILGHDGSLTAAFNDWRDAIMLALEQTIYANLPPQLQTEARPGFDLQQWLGGAFIAPFNGYTRAEITPMLTPWFELWVQQNRFDYRAHTDYDAQNPFTWNFNGVLDRAGNPLPGNWRAIYRWYYDTEAPHLRPWEMLGFVSQPSWWQAAYGPPDPVSLAYKRGNTTLWTDLEHGTIVGGPRQGTDLRYARAGLSNLIPVDANGGLLDPIAAGIVTGNITAMTASRPWTVGDQAPIENLWIVSASYRFALGLLGFLLKPARYVEQCWDVLNIGYVGDQWVNYSTLARPLNSEQYVHGESPDGVPIQVIGVSQWIADYLGSGGLTSAAFGAAIRGLDVRLIHQMAGFTSADDMQVVADNFGLVPAENTAVTLYTSPTSRTEVYSAVLLEWTGHSWRAIGYDARNAYFTIIPPDLNGPKGLISIANAAEPTIVQWRPNVYYPSGILVEYLNSIWQCQRGHTSASQFEQTFWTARPDLNTAMIRAPRVITYLRGLPTTQQIPYGTEFIDYQSVANFVLGWQRWLVSRGWSFTDTDPATGTVRDWSLSVMEFLTWAQVQWAPGNFITLSPGQQQLTFTAETGTILNVEDNTTGFFGLIDRSGRPIGQREAIISRLDGNLTIQAKQADIFSARLALVTQEHVLVLSNTTIFDDAIYLPLYNLRQTRLLLICKRAPNWTGRLDAPGFIITGDTIKSDFEKATEDVRLMFDIESPDRQDLRTYARHVIGFQTRDYLENLLLSNVEQFEFYQGMIQQKGTPGVFDKLTRSNRASNNSNLQFLEEWAIRIDEFGAPIDPFLILQLRQIDTRDDPQIVRLIPNPSVSRYGLGTYGTGLYSAVSTPSAPLDWIELSPTDARWVDQPPDTAFFSMRPYPTALPTAGPVRLSEVLYTIFHYSNNGVNDVTTLYTPTFQAGLVPFPTASLTWVYERPDGTYTVLRSFDIGPLSSDPMPINTANAILKIITNNEDPTIPNTITRIIFQQPLSLNPLLRGVSGIGCAGALCNGSASVSPVIPPPPNVSDLGNYLVIDGLSLAVPEFQGLVSIVAINLATNSVDIAIAGTTGYDFTPTPSTAPLVRVLREVRFASHATMLAANYAFAVGDLVWLDQAPRYWAVLQLSGANDWTRVREQPVRTDATTISETVIYSQGTQVIGQQMLIDEPVVDDIVVIDPLAGLIAGIADREIDFKCDSDPARYNAGATIAAANPWGPNEVGRVWWNLAPVKFLDPFTDRIGIDDARDVTELTYRCANWSHLAPGTSVDVYEWTESTSEPTVYSGPGTVFNGDPGVSPAEAEANGDTSQVCWVARDVYDVQLGRPTTLYYFWVTGLTVTPIVPFRHTDITTVALAITNPSALDLAWMAPIHQDTFIVSGVAQFLNDTTTVMKVRLDGYRTRNKDRSENPGRHNEWLLMRPTDETSLPTAAIWQKLRDSLAGFDMLLRPIPDPSLSVTRATGVRQTQGMFAVDSSLGTRMGLLAARQSFVGIVNNILAAVPMQRDRTADVLTLYRSTLRLSDGLVIAPNLNWAQPNNSFVIEPPPDNEWDVQVFTLDQQNRLLDREDFRTATHNIRVLLDGRANPIPQWSIWDYNWNTKSPPFSLATAYEFVVADRTARNNLAGTLANQWASDPTAVRRVFVTSDTDGFWAIWNYLPEDSAADVYGFVLWRVQSYRTDDFVATVDWYAPGYSSTDPPIVIYDTIGARNRTEGTTPVSQFVKINDDGTSAHHWIWTQYDPGIAQWTTVALQNGTIALSGNFYNPTCVPLAIGNFTLDAIVNRDGSWELFVLVDILRYGGLLLDTEINEIFFSILNFVHVQQASVDWAFKTSFMTVIGYDVPLQQTPVLLSDQTPSLLAFVNEVKPYHVKVRDLSTQYNTDLDTGNVTISSANTFDITLLFDRYDLSGWDTQPWDDRWDSGDRIANGATGAMLDAAQRIALYYPVPAAMTPTDWASLLGTDLRPPLEISGTALLSTPPDSEYVGIVWPGHGRLSSGSILILGVSGTAMAGGLLNGTASLVPSPYDVLLNPDPLPNQPGGYDLRDPYHSADHPEERVPFNADDALHLLITSQPVAGQPPQIVKSFDVREVTSPTVTLPYDRIAQSATAVLVFCDGIRQILDIDYSVDYFGCTVTIYDLIGVSTITLHAFGFGGTSAITTADYLSGDDDPFIMVSAATTSSTAIVVADGTPTAFTVNPLLQSVTGSGDTGALFSGADSITEPANMTTAANLLTATGRDIAIVTYSGGATTATQIAVQHFTFDPAVTPPNQWPLASPDTDTVPEYAGTIVEVNGSRLTPPSTDYGLVQASLPISLAQADYIIDVDVAGNHNLTIIAPLNPGDQITVTTFSNAAAMGIKTVAYPVIEGYGSGDYGVSTYGQLTTPVYPVPQPIEPQYALITMNGLALTLGVDYTLAPTSNPTTALLTILAPMTTGNVVAMMFTAPIAQDFRQWMSNSQVPATIRMPPIMQPSGYGSGDYSMGDYGQGALQQTGLFGLRDEYISVPANAGTLASIDSIAITITLPRLLPAVSDAQGDPVYGQPYGIPTWTSPGVIWIGGERIEYFGYNCVDNLVTLTGLRRATRGTSMSPVLLGTPVYNGNTVIAAPPY